MLDPRMVMVEMLSDLWVTTPVCFDCSRKAVVLQAQNQMTEAHKLLQKLLTYCQKLKNTEMVIR